MGCSEDHCSCSFGERRRLERFSADEKEGPDRNLEGWCKGARGPNEKRSNPSIDCCASPSWRAEEGSSWFVGLNVGVERSRERG